MQHLRRDAYGLFFLAVLGYLSKVLVNIFLAHHLSEATYGDYNVALKILNILVIITLFGTNVSANRFLAKYLQTHNENKASAYIKWNIKLVGITFSFVLMIALVSFLSMMGFHYLGIKDINQYHLLLYMLWLVPFAAAAALCASFLQSNERGFLALFYLNVVRYVTQFILFFLIVVFVSPTFNNLSLLSVLFITFILVNLLSMTSLNKNMITMLQQGLKEFAETPVLHVGWLRTSAELICNNIIFSLVCALDLIAVEVFGKNEASVGHYAAVITITAIIWLISMNAYRTLTPELSYLLDSEKGKSELQIKLNQINKVVIFLTLLLTSLIIIFSDALLSFFGPTYYQAKIALIILSLGICFTSINRISPVLLIYAGYEHLTLCISVAEFFLLCFLVMPLTYYFNITGAALAAAITMCSKAICGVILVNKKLGLKPLIFT